MSDQTIRYDEEMVGAGHPTKADTLNRLTLVEADTDGHGQVRYLKKQAGEPTVPSDEGALYTADENGETCLYFKTESQTTKLAPTTPVVRTHIMRFSLMGTLQIGTNWISALVGFGGTAKTLFVQNDGTGGTATFNLVRYSGGGQNIFTGAVSTNAGAEFALNASLSALDYLRIDITAISGTPTNLKVCILIEEA